MLFVETIHDPTVLDSDGLPTATAAESLVVSVVTAWDKLASERRDADTRRHTTTTATAATVAVATAATTTAEAAHLGQARINLLVSLPEDVDEIAGLLGVWVGLALLLNAKWGGEMAHSQR